MTGWISGACAPSEPPADELVGLLIDRLERGPWAVKGPVPVAIQLDENVWVQVGVLDLSKLMAEVFGGEES